jgi:diguanylate cyclase (GGDEF)-like protein
MERLAPLDDKTAVSLEIEIIGQVSGRHRQMVVSIIPVVGTGADRVYTAILVDVSARRNDESCTRFLARQDSLTGLPNRAAFDEKARQALAIARRNGSIVALLCIDLDRFKAVNDAHGATTGDGLLREVAHRLQAITRESDIIARFGGDEFALLATNLHEPGEIDALARKVATRLGEPYDIHGSSISCSVSVGSALYPADGADLDMLFDAADAELHRSKGDANRAPPDGKVIRGAGLFRRLAEPPIPRAP